MEVGAKDQKPRDFLLKMEPFNNFYVEEAHTVQASIGRHNVKMSICLSFLSHFLGL